MALPVEICEEKWNHVIPFLSAHTYTLYTSFRVQLSAASRMKVHAHGRRYRRRLRIVRVGHHLLLVRSRYGSCTALNLFIDTVSHLLRRSAGSKSLALSYALQVLDRAFLGSRRCTYLCSIVEKLSCRSMK